MADAEYETSPEAMTDGEQSAYWPEADEFVAEHYGLAGEVLPVDIDPPRFFIRYEEVTCRLDFGEEQQLFERFKIEHELLHRLRGETGRIGAPEPLAAQQGADLISLDGSLAEGDQAFARLFAFPPGEPMPDLAELSDLEIGRIGTFAAQLSRDLVAISDLEGHATQTSQLIVDQDLRQVGPQVVHCLRNLTEPAVRDPIARATVTALRQVQPLGEQLRVQLIHHRPIGDNLVGLPGEAGWVPTGFTSPELLGSGWVVASLAGVCAEILQRGTGGASSVLPAIKAFHAELPLTEAELTALWPLVVATVARERAQHELASKDVSASPKLQESRTGFEKTADVEPGVMHAAILQAVEWPLPETAEFLPLLPELDLQDLRLVDLSATSPLFVDGNWNDPEIDWRLLARIAWETKMGATRFGEYRLSRGSADADARNVALHIDICLPAGATVAAPFGGTVKQTSGPLILSGKDATLYLEGVETVLAEGTMLFAGDRLGSVGGPEGSVGGLRIRLARSPDVDPPLFCSGNELGLWKRLVLSPSMVLGLNVDAPDVAGEGYVRGWNEYLFDSFGHRRIDLTGSAGILGYGHGVLAEAAYRQWLTLGGTVGTSLEAEYQAALLQDMPGHLDTVLALTDETQAMEIARQLADKLFDDPDAVLIADERQSGFWRNGKNAWSFQTAEQTPDIVITGSPVPQERLAAVIISRSVLPDGLELPQPDATAVACRMGLAVLDALDDAALRREASNAADLLWTRLEELSNRNPALIGIEGSGLDLRLKLSGLDATEVANLLQGLGVLVSPPTASDAISVVAPLTLSEGAVAEFVEALAACLPAVESGQDEQARDLEPQDKPDPQFESERERM